MLSKVGSKPTGAWKQLCTPAATVSSLLSSSSSATPLPPPDTTLLRSPAASASAQRLTLSFFSAAARASWRRLRLYILPFERLREPRITFLKPYCRTVKGFERKSPLSQQTLKEHRAAERALVGHRSIGREHGSHQDAYSLPRSEDDPSTQSGLLCSLSSAEEQLQHYVGGVPLKKTQQTCTFTASAPRDSNAAALLHALIMCSGATSSGAGSMHRAFCSIDHHHITVNDSDISRAPEWVPCHG